MQRIKNAIKLVGIGMLLCACSGNLEIPSGSKTASNLQQQRTTQLHGTALVVSGSASDKEPPGGSSGGGTPSIKTPYATTYGQHGNTTASQPQEPNTPQYTKAEQPQPAKNNPPAGVTPQPPAAAPGSGNIYFNDDNANSKANAAQQQPNTAAGGGVPQPTPTPNRQNDAPKNTDPAQQPTMPEIAKEGNAPNPATAEDQKKAEDEERKKAKKAGDEVQQSTEESADRVPVDDGQAVETEKKGIGEGTRPTEEELKRNSDGLGKGHRQRNRQWGSLPGSFNKRAARTAQREKEKTSCDKCHVQTISVGEAGTRKVNIKLTDKNGAFLPNTKVDPNAVAGVTITVTADKKNDFEIRIDGVEQKSDRVSDDERVGQFRIKHTFSAKARKRGHAIIKVKTKNRSNPKPIEYTIPLKL